ncbi:hypothetical protein PF007_g16346 [Phytophthora fragariae]|uniref:Uncharacterized protein n=1 Tax=Phytophthora fragariae TaxID=53985 RepID=A0A6A3JA78_9STRA|nr:hypothetical protein PF011_g17929 [Phytophthora fragariae]KAE9098226.1 hypothetical protein PF007_g16346 [Phytophthora fragariae]
MFSFLSQSPATPPKQRVRSSQTSLQKNPSSVDAARCVKGSRLSRQASSADRLSSGSRVKRALCASGAEDEYGEAKTRKIATPFSEIAPSFPWLRSGRRFSHLSVVEAATMQCSLQASRTSTSQSSTKNTANRSIIKRFPQQSCRRKPSEPMKSLCERLGAGIAPIYN